MSKEVEYVQIKDKIFCEEITYITTDYYTGEGISRHLLKLLDSRKKECLVLCDCTTITYYWVREKFMRLIFTSTFEPTDLYR